MPRRRLCSMACPSVSTGFAPAAPTWRPRQVSTTGSNLAGPRASRPASSHTHADRVHLARFMIMSERDARGPEEHERAWRPAVRQERLAGEAQAVFAHPLERDAGVALHDD